MTLETPTAKSEPLPLCHPESLHAACLRGARTSLKVSKRTFDVCGSLGLFGRLYFVEMSFEPTMCMLTSIVVEAAAATLPDGDYLDRQGLVCPGESCADMHALSVRPKPQIKNQSLRTQRWN